MANDLIVRLYPYNDDASPRYAVKVITKSPRCVFPDFSHQPEENIFASRGSREPTASRQATPQDSSIPVDRPYLALNFSWGPQTTSGFVFGVDKTCDVVLPSSNQLGLSRRHFALTYKHLDDGLPRLIIRDLGSTHGISVTYNDLGGEVRRNFDWVLQDCPVPGGNDLLVVRVHRYLQFQLVVTHQDIRSAEYAQKVARFQRGEARAEDLFGGLDVQSGPATLLNTTAHTPVQQPIHIPIGDLGQGFPAHSSRHWNVSTGRQVVCRTPDGASLSSYDWAGISAIMSEVNHVSKPLCAGRHDGESEGVLTLDPSRRTSFNSLVTTKRTWGLSCTTNMRSSETYTKYTSEPHFQSGSSFPSSVNAHQL